MSGVKCRFGAYYVVGERKTRLAVLHQPLYLAMAQNSLSNCWWPWTPEAYPLSQFSSSAVIKSLKLRPLPRQLKQHCQATTFDPYGSQLPDFSGLDATAIDKANLASARISQSSGVQLFSELKW